MNDDWKGKHYSFFQNPLCEYFPCHKTQHPEDFNCIFCYCPLYALGDTCGGGFSYTPKGIKDCSGCIFPHQRDNFGKVLERFSDVVALGNGKNSQKI